MSILAFIGLPGSGKSYGIVQNVVVPNLQKRRTIVTNLPLRPEALRADLFDPFEALPIHILTDEQFKTLDLLKEYPGAVFIIDECQRYFPAGMTEAKLPGHYKDFFSMHRHSACPVTGFTSEIVLASQCTSKIASPVRTLIEYTYIAKKMSSVGADNRYRVDVYEGCQSIKYKKGHYVRQIFGKYEEPFVNYYKSHTQSSDNVVANEEKADQRASIWKSGKVKMYVGAMLLSPILILVAVFQVRSALDFGGEDQTASAVPASPDSEQRQSAGTQDYIHRTASAAVYQPAPTSRREPEAAQAVYRLPDLVSPESDHDWVHFELSELGARSVYRAVTQDHVTLDVSGLEPSPEWRYMGRFYHSDGTVSHHAVSAQGAVRRVPSHDCVYYQQVSDYVCVIGHHQVASWTGVSADLGSMATHQAPRTIGQ